MSLTRRFVLTGLIAAPAVIAMARLMPVQSIIKPYATVWGVGWDLEVIEHQIWEPLSVAQFGGTNAIDQFREVTQWVYGFPVDTSSQPPLSHRHSVPKKYQDPLERFYVPDRIEGTPFWPAGFNPPRYNLAKDMGPSAQVGIWDPNRAVKDDEATGGNNRSDRRNRFLVDESIQQHFDATHHWEKKWQAKYPVLGMPPGDSPEWDVFHSERAKAGKLTGRKLAFKAAFG